MRSEIKIKNNAGIAVIDIEGVIGVPERMQFENPEQRVATYARFTETLKKIGTLQAREVVVNICSTGGDVNDALLIYEALAGLETRVTTRCRGYVASAATIIAQAASQGRREISSGALYLIHCSESAAEGNAESMSRTRDMLRATDERIAEIYAARAGREVEEFAALMNENGGSGRWLSAAEALEAGLVDRVVPMGAAIGGVSGRVVDGAVGDVAGRANGDFAGVGGVAEGQVTEEEVPVAELAAILEMLGLPDIPGGCGAEVTGADGVDGEVGGGLAGGAGDGGAEVARAGVRRRLSAMWRSLVGGFWAALRSSGIVPDGGGLSAENAVCSGAGGDVGCAVGVGAGTSGVGVAGQEGLPVNAKTVAPERRRAQDTAKPTKVTQVEDPSPREYVRTDNEQAYEADAWNIRQG